MSTCLLRQRHMPHPKRSQVADEHAQESCERKPFPARTEEQGNQDAPYNSERHLPESGIAKRVGLELWSGDRSKEPAGTSQQADAPQGVAEAEATEGHKCRREGGRDSGSQFPTTVTI